MCPQFQELTPQWFKRAFVYTGSIGDFRYRFATDSKAGLLHCAVYTKVCYEKATDVTAQDFPWDEAGVAQLQGWLQTQYDTFLQA